jgi:hypothetical protein
MVDGLAVTDSLQVAELIRDSEDTESPDSTKKRSSPPMKGARWSRGYPLTLDTLEGNKISLGKRHSAHKKQRADFDKRWHIEAKRAARRRGAQAHAVVKGAEHILVAGFLADASTGEIVF